MTTRPEATTIGGQYVFDNEWDEERDRLSSLEAGWDPATIGHLEATGVSEGWRCLEIGAGAGSIAAWLCERVGPSGKVVATDLDTRLLRSIVASNLDLRQHDILQDGLETGAFDLVHARLLLEHLPATDIALDKMLTALKPGGWLLVEDFDHVTFLADPIAGSETVALWQRFLTAFEALSGRRGLDLTYGRKLKHALDARMLVDAVVTGRSSMESGGSKLSRALSLSIAKLQDALIETGAMDAQDITSLRVLLEDPSFHWMSQLMVSAMARKG